ncbi:hypothetical protein X801_06099 [Opisthorchis viverrini]|uniref:Uncharacterized protein n=1 Tax=Opisthorchis viverrini TaxID=6198 RepID=A0A1S8WUY4_OPIVI|nr:hypothetical protein X801_06099 [Opisthorchis viverrini]
MLRPLLVAHQPLMEDRKEVLYGSKDKCDKRNRRIFASHRVIHAVCLGATAVPLEVEYIQHDKRRLLRGDNPLEFTRASV